jgi:hypothetical protein
MMDANNINFIFDIDHGFVIKITNFTEFTKEFDWYIPKINIATGQEIEIQVSRSFVNKLKWPYSECKFDSNIDMLTGQKGDFFRNKMYKRAYCNEIGKINLKNISLLKNYNLFLI